MALVWPINQSPVVPWDVNPEDNLLKSPTDAGYILTRPKYTRACRVWGPFTWQYLTTEQMGLVGGFYETTTAYGSREFSFPVKVGNVQQSVTVRFHSPPKYTYIGYDKWLVVCSFREV